MDDEDFDELGDAAYPTGHGAQFDEAEETSLAGLEAASDFVWDDETDDPTDEESLADRSRDAVESPADVLHPPGSSPSFRPIPERDEPPLAWLAVLGLILVTVLLLFWQVFGPTGGPAEVPPIGAEITPTTQHAAPDAQPGAMGAASQPDSPAATPMGRQGQLTVRTDTRAKIYVDGRDVGWAPVVGLSITSGPHNIEAIAVNTGTKKSASTQIEPDQDRVVRIDFR